MTLNQRIQQFYDQSSPLWLEMWGEHMHHGYYGADGKIRKNNQEAQRDLIEELLRWGEVASPRRILDAGCGVGGSARYLARKYDAEVLGVTLSPVQAERAAVYNEQAGLSRQVAIQARDIYTLSAADGPFDLVYSMESAEHMPDKAALLALFQQVLRPGGQFVMATWCHRSTTARPLTRKEQNQLAKLSRYYHLPPMIDIDRYRELALAAGFTDVRTDDWSRAVAPFWAAVIRSALSVRAVVGLLRAGPGTLRGAWAMRYMQAGFRSGLLEFGVLRAHRP